MGYIVASIVIVGTVLALFSDVFRRRKFARMSAVNPGVEYPNNHHVMGVGYYHAASQRRFPHPWNEYREVVVITGMAFGTRPRISGWF